MATVCGSSLALFDAGIHWSFLNVLSLVICLIWSLSGVPMSKHAAGVACGLILDSKSGSDDIHRYQILSDINVSEVCQWLAHHAFLLTFHDTNV